LHLVEFYFMNCTMMHGSTNIKTYKKSKFKKKNRSQVVLDDFKVCSLVRQYAQLMFSPFRIYFWLKLLFVCVLSIHQFMKYI